MPVHVPGTDEIVQVHRGVGRSSGGGRPQGDEDDPCTQAVRRLTCLLAWGPPRNRAPGRYVPDPSSLNVSAALGPTAVSLSVHSLTYHRVKSVAYVGAIRRPVTMVVSHVRKYGTEFDASNRAPSEPAIRAIGTSAHRQRRVYAGSRLWPRGTTGPDSHTTLGDFEKSLARGRDAEMSSTGIEDSGVGHARTWSHQGGGFEPDRGASGDLRFGTNRANSGDETEIPVSVPCCRERCACDPRHIRRRCVGSCLKRCPAVGPIARPEHDAAPVAGVSLRQLLGGQHILPPPAEKLPGDTKRCPCEVGVLAIPLNQELGARRNIDARASVDADKLSETSVGLAQSGKGTPESSHPHRLSHEQAPQTGHIDPFRMDGKPSDEQVEDS